MAQLSVSSCLKVKSKTVEVETQPNPQSGSLERTTKVVDYQLVANWTVTLKADNRQGAWAVGNWVSWADRRNNEPFRCVGSAK